MKKVLHSLIMAALCIVGVANSNAQSQISLDSSNKTKTPILSSSHNMDVIQIGDQTTFYSFGKEHKHSKRTKTNTHVLTINGTDGDIFTIEVTSSNSDEYFNWIDYEPTFTDSVIEEGYYDIRIIGEQDNGYHCVLTYDQIPVFDNVTIDASLNECVYGVDAIPIDENGNPISLSDIIDVECLLSQSWSNGTMGASFGLPKDVIQFMRFNSFDERTYLCLTANYYTQEQTVYNITFPICHGLSDNIVFENEEDDLHQHQEKYHISSYAPRYCLNFSIFYDENIYTAFGYTFVPFTLDSPIGFDSDLPLTIISNNRIDDTSIYTDIPHILLMPAIYETIPEGYSWPQYDNFIIPFGMYYNAENQLVREPFGQLKDAMAGGLIPSYPEYFPETPAITINDPGTMLYFGERTPMSYYNAYALKANESFSGKNTFKPNVISIGENGCQRIGDKSAIATIVYDGVEIFNDSLYKWPFYQEFQSEEAGDVTMVINNNHLTMEGVEKSNQTFIEFNFNKEDVTAPTLTILQVRDENDKESIELPNIESSYINFAAGDFSPHYTEEGGYGHFDYMQYDGKPNIEINYAITDPITGNDFNWMPLEYTEIENMFHESYGNYFTIDLSQLPAEAVGNWISLEFILADDVWNIMQQELSNVFYVGRLESVNEQTALTHTVYPNPFNGEVRITSSETVNGNAIFNVYNVLGAQMYHQTMNCANTTEFIWDGSQVPSGIYFYSISTENGILQGKIIKE